MLPEQPVGNPGLESEYLTSCIFKGVLYPPEYSNLRINLASLIFISASNTLTGKLLELQEEVVSKFGILDDKPLEKFFYGENPELERLVISIHKELKGLELLYGVATEEQFMQIADKVAQGAQTMKYEDMGQAIDETASDADHMHGMDQTHLQLRKMIGTVEAILRVYGFSDKKLYKKSKIVPKAGTAYKMYLQDLSNNVDAVCKNVRMASVIGKVLDTIIHLLPSDDLDPYLMDVCNNFIDVAVDPKSFYIMCQQDEIISPSVGQMFGHCYPEYYSKFIDMYMDKVSDMDYQSQLDFRKCFGMAPDNSQLTMLCSQYIKLGFKQQ